ncbi:MAG TPA: hypothetical protein VKB39_11150, partial [Candidatus Baltobacteraceae bacterium]|nr:hypothetical protein [Candidatus Baltobacteraceae bacterium]
RVQIKQFDMQPNVTTANFVVANATTSAGGGRIRFQVKHPNGAKANYTFQTSTGQIAVRGTEGDIWAPQEGALQVNVYEITDPALPVEVTLKDGKVYKLNAGQTLTVGITGAIVAASSSGSVNSTTQTSMSNFSEFGAVSETAAVAAAAAASAAAASAGGIPAVAAVAAGVAAIGGVVIGTSHSGSEPAPSPAPGSVVVNPTSLTFSPGTGPLTFHASQKHFNGTFHASVDAGSIASVNATSPSGDFTVTPKSNGTTTITVSGGSGETTPVGVSVEATTITVPGSLPTFRSLNEAKSFTAQETYYAGGFTAKSNDTTIAKVTTPGSSSSGGGNFTVTSVGNGSTTITVSDSLGHSAPVSVKVNGPTPKPSPTPTLSPTPAPTPTSIPICIGMPVSGGRAQGTHHRMDPAMAAAPGRPNPAATPTCPPTPMAGPPLAKPIAPPVVRAPQPHPIGPQPPTVLPPHVPGMPTPPPMPGGPP